ncbi:TlpA family protein disulfide reductase [Lachnoclostridium phytofermentans]|uniref:Redoxin domain protein n=1 Tax=Lachnoclostridium phytofermentans (strain ATCC 700394 / DSM 18823 / ISDg) TaxID=357809 RepID=A9KJW7_LACP7|nr:TlpA disulfide reductase family protein [Lachnoclostridium phytofermentans]ABX41122.1 Redoxin domain protein [Lachnoclostridium phytofermentans ISDg]
MKNKKILWILAIFVVLIVGATVLYKNLSKNYAEQEENNEVNKQENITPTTEPEDSSNNTSDPTITEDPEPTMFPAIDFSMQDIDGNTVSLSDYYGKPIVLNFWASWCGPCKSEMPEFNKVYLDLKDDVNFLMVDLVDGTRETIKKGSKFVENNGYEFPVFFDVEQEGAYYYSVMAIPSTIIIDKDGNIANYYQGAISESVLKKELDALLGE